MRFAIVESGGKQYRAIEGRTIEVDRLAVETGKKFGFDRILLMADGDDVMVGTPTVSDIQVKVTVVDHTKGPKIDRFKYRPRNASACAADIASSTPACWWISSDKPGEERKVEEA